MFFWEGVAPMIYLQEGLCDVTESRSNCFRLSFVSVAVSHSGHHDSLVRGIVICYTRSFHLFSLLFLRVAFSHCGHPDSLARGIVICYTKSAGTLQGGRVVCPPVERGRATC